MIIDNAKTIVKYRLWSLALSVFFLMILLTLLILIKKELFGVSKYYLTIIVGSIYIGYNLYIVLLNRNYLHYSDETDKLEFKFYSTLPFVSRNNYIVIPKNIFEKFEIKSSLGGLKPKLTLYQKSGKGGLAKYKPICLSALTEEEKDQLINSLRSFSAK